MKLSKKGSVDSKYFGKLNQFEKDVNDKAAKRNIDKNNIKNELIRLIESNPTQMKREYDLIIENLIEIKKEYDF